MVPAEGEHCPQLLSLYFCRHGGSNLEVLLLFFVRAYVESRFRVDSSSLEGIKCAIILIYCHAFSRIYPTLSSWVVTEILSTLSYGTWDRFVLVFILAVQNSLT